MIGTPGNQPNLAKRNSKAGGIDTGMSATGNKRCRTKIKNVVFVLVLVGFKDPAAIR